MITFTHQLIPVKIGPRRKLGETMPRTLEYMHKFILKNIDFHLEICYISNKGDVKRIYPEARSNKMIKFIQTPELEQIARRVWNARSDKATRNAFNEKVASFEAMGFASQSTEFPMRSGEWTPAGSLEISISYSKWDIPGFIRVRKPVAVAVPA